MEKIQEMVLDAKKGDMDAFSWLYKETYERNYYIVIKMVRQEQDAMDILQDTYVKVFQKMSSFTYSGSQSFASWTSKIASNTALDFLRKKKTSQSWNLRMKQPETSQSLHLTRKKLQELYMNLWIVCLKNRGFVLSCAI